MLYSIFMEGYGRKGTVMWGEGQLFITDLFSPITCRLFNRLQSILLFEMAGSVCLLAETTIMIMEETLEGNNQNVA